MKLKLLTATALAGALFGPAAFAQESGWYGAIDLGAHHVRPIQLDTSGLPGNGFNQRTNWDFAGFARIGYRFSPHFRLELEGGYRPAGIEHMIRLNPPSDENFNVCAVASAENTCPAPNGSVDSYTGMVNALIDILPNFVINPFIGGGVGINHVRENVNGELFLFGDDTGQSLTVHDSHTEFAYQGIGGLSWRANDRLNIDLTYRYLSGSRMHFNSVSSGDITPGVLSGTYSDNSITLGLRYSFAAPPPRRRLPRRRRRRLPRRRLPRRRRRRRRRRPSRRATM